MRARTIGKRGCPGGGWHTGSLGGSRTSEAKAADGALRTRCDEANGQCTQSGRSHPRVANRGASHSASRGSGLPFVRFKTRVRRARSDPRVYQIMLRAVFLLSILGFARGCRPTVTCDEASSVGGPSVCHATWVCTFQPTVPGASTPLKFYIDSGVVDGTGLLFNFSRAPGSLIGGTYGGTPSCTPAGCDTNDVSLTFQSEDLQASYTTGECEVGTPRPSATSSRLARTQSRRRRRSPSSPRGCGAPIRCCRASG